MEFPHFNRIFHCLFQRQRMTSKMEEIDGRPAQFGCTVEELQQLMESRGHEGYQLIQNQYGGVLEICKRLYTSPNEGKLQMLDIKRRLLVFATVNNTVLKKGIC